MKLIQGSTLQLVLIHVVFLLIQEHEFPKWIEPISPNLRNALTYNLRPELIAKPENTKTNSAPIRHATYINKPAVKLQIKLVNLTPRRFWTKLAAVGQNHEYPHQLSLPPIFSSCTMKVSKSLYQRDGFH